MALPSSGDLNTSQVYQERWGYGTSPSGSYSLEQLQDDWNLPETPDNTDIFYGKGRAVFSIGNAYSEGNNIYMDWSIFEGTGFSESGDIEFRFYYEEQDTGTVTYDTGWFSRAYNSSDSGTHTFSGLDYDTDYYVGIEVQLQNWSGLTYEEEYFQVIATEAEPPQNVSLVQDGDFADLTWDDPSSGQPANGYEWEIGTSSGTTTGNSATDSVCGDEVPSGETGSVSGQVRSLGSESNSNWVADSTNMDCTTFCLVTGTDVTLLDGSTKLIENLEEGDVILGADIPSLEDTNKLSELFAWRSGLLSEKSAVSTIAKIEKVTNKTVVDINDGLIMATGSHTQLVKRGANWKFVPMRNVQEGDLLRKENGDTVPVETTEKINKRHTVYRLTLEQPFHTFYANGILTHNVK